MINYNALLRTTSILLLIRNYNSLIMSDILTFGEIDAIIILLLLTPDKANKRRDNLGLL